MIRRVFSLSIFVGRYITKKFLTNKGYITSLVTYGKSYFSIKLKIQDGIVSKSRKFEIIL